MILVVERLWLDLIRFMLIKIKSICDRRKWSRWSSRRNRFCV